MYKHFFLVFGHNRNPDKILNCIQLIEGCARVKVDRSRLRLRLLSNTLFVLVEKEMEELIF
jgi:hypothetical protein